MVLSPVSILGGDSVYCINEAQMEHAKKLAEEDPESSIKIKSIMETLESDLFQHSLELRLLRLQLTQRLNHLQRLRMHPQIGHVYRVLICPLQYIF